MVEYNIFDKVLMMGIVAFIGWLIYQRLMGNQGMEILKEKLKGDDGIGRFKLRSNR